MKKLSFSLLATLTLIVINTLPSQALQQQSKKESTVENQIQTSQTLNAYRFCIWRAMGIEICY